MRYYHYVVVVPVDEDDSIDKPYIDENATLPDIDEPVWNDEADEWERSDDKINKRIVKILNAVKF